jgi:hypothetical protein
MNAGNGITIAGIGMVGAIGTISTFRFGRARFS